MTTYLRKSCSFGLPNNNSKENKFFYTNIPVIWVMTYNNKHIMNKSNPFQHSHKYTILMHMFDKISISDGIKTMVWIIRLSIIQKTHFKTQLIGHFFMYLPKPFITFYYFDINTVVVVVLLFTSTVNS